MCNVATVGIVDERYGEPKYEKVQTDGSQVIEAQATESECSMNATLRRSNLTG